MSDDSDNRGELMETDRLRELKDLRARLAALERKLAAAESACREALGEPSAHGLADWGWLVAINAREGNIPEQRRCEKKRDEIHAKLRAVLAGDGEAKPDTRRCPRCGKLGEWRRGYEFDGEKRCADCKLVWVPDYEDKWLEMRDAARAPGREGGA